MARHEHLCFADAAGLEPDQLDMHFMTAGAVPKALMDRAAPIFFGGSGAFSVLDEVPWIHRTLDQLLVVVQAQRPAYASCFGFQGLARALGGVVENDESRKELGATALRLTEAGRRDPLFADLPDQFWAEQGHHDHVTTLPDGVELLATGDVIEAQAFRVVGTPFWASQFHPELTPARTLDRFLHYRDQYVGADSADALETRLRTERRQTPEVGRLLARLVQGV